MNDMIDLSVLGDTDAQTRLLQAQRLSDAGLRQWQAGRDPAAASLLRRAVALAPGLVSATANLGLVLWRLGEIEQADDLLRRAAGADSPDRAAVHNNLGVFYASMSQWEFADIHFARAITLAPDRVAPVWDQAISLLERGDWAAGWPGYESRLKMGDHRQYPALPVPLWQGEPLDGRTLYVRGEQGVGDRIQFSRYVAAVKSRWPTCRILFAPHDDLLPLLWCYRAVCELLPAGMPCPADADFGVFLCSLPGLLGARPLRIEPDPGFIRAQALAQCSGATPLPLPHLPSIKVGIVWTGNPAHARNQARSIPLELLLPLAEDPRITLYAFQVGPGAADIASVGCSDLVHALGPALAAEGWMATALALLQLDALVAVDTGLAHLAGALDVPTFLLLPHQPDWRWGCGRPGLTPDWYRSVRIRRQQADRDWKPMVASARIWLGRLAESRLAARTPAAA